MGGTAITLEIAEVDALRAALAARSPVSAFCHENPDADTIGAAATIARIAMRMGAPAEVVAERGVPEAYGWLLRGLRVSHRPTLEPGLAVVCDAATLDRIGEVARDCSAWLDRATIVNIDHHVTNDRFGAINLVDPTAAASCQIVSELLPQLGLALDLELAEGLLAGIVRDSNGFSTAATSAATLRAAADAVEAGANLERIYRASVLELEERAMDLWARLLNRMSRTAAGRVLYTTLLPGDLDETGGEQHDAEGLVEFLTRGRGVEVALLFRQLDHGVRVSFRTAHGVNAAALAGQFGGGGHDRRAGCVVPGALDEVLPTVLSAAEAAVS